MAKLLLIVEEDRRDLYNYLTWHFSSEKDVQIILDRRRTERRVRVRPCGPERREVDRRLPPTVRRDPLSLNQVITREEVASSKRTRPRFRPIRRDWSGVDNEMPGASLAETSCALPELARPAL